MTANDGLAGLIGGQPPAEVARLPAPVRRHLAELVTRAQADQRRRLDQAIDGGLEHLPRLLRRPIRQILF